METASGGQTGSHTWRAGQLNGQASWCRGMELWGNLWKTHRERETSRLNYKVQEVQEEYGTVFRICFNNFFIN